MAARESKAAKAISEKMSQIEPGTPRYEALEIARRFKTSWVELGGTLAGVRRKKLYEQWGFPSFEAYCKDEIRIKPRTAAKLTASFSFLKEQEPAVLRRDGLERPIPDMAAVDVLRRAREDEQVGDDQYRRIKEMALDEASPASLRREYREAQGPPEPPSQQEAVKKLVKQADRLADSLAAVQGIPRVILERAVALVDDLKALVSH
jgi:hypothetical protein